MSELVEKTAIENGDLSEQLEFDFNKKELEPISFGNLPPTFIDMLNIELFTELLKGDKKD
jgi:hypothetical protein